jgi:acyl-CoA thioester hydrolase
MVLDAPNNRARYKFWTSVTLRYGDTDSLGHINNVVFATLLEAGRAAMLFDRHGAIAGPGKTFVIVHLAIDFRAEMHYPGTAEVGTSLVSFGKSSLRLHQAVFKEDVCVAVADSTIVLIDEETRSATPIPEEIKAIIQAASDGKAVQVGKGVRKS